MFFQAHRVKTKPIHIIHYQQNIFVTGIYFTEEFTQVHLCISPEINQHQRPPMKADRSHLHKGSPSLVKAPLTQHLSKPQTVPSALSSGHSCQGLLHCSGTPVTCAYWLYFLLFCTTQHFSASSCPWGNGKICIIWRVPKTWAWLHTAELCSEQ